MKNLVPKRVMEYIVITFAVILMDVGIYVFKFPNNFSFGGVSGMAVVFSHFIPMTSAQINLVINLILLVIGFMILGKDFGMKTAYVTVVSSLLLNVFEKVFPMEKALTGNIMLELCFAIILPALAAAILFFENASGGGTDIVAMIIKKYSTMNISGALFLVDCFIVVVSFTFTQFATPLMEKLGWPTLFCNTLEVAEDGEITGFRMRCEQSKLTTVKALQSMGFETIASGDSYNDLGMIKASKAGFLFRSTEQIKADNPDIPAYEEYDELLAAIKKAMK